MKTLADELVPRRLRVDGFHVARVERLDPPPLSLIADALAVYVVTCAHCDRAWCWPVNMEPGDRVRLQLRHHQAAEHAPRSAASTARAQVRR